MMAPCVPGNAEPGVAASKRLATPCNTMHHRTQQAGWLVAWGLCECMLMCASMVWLLLSLFCNYTAGPLGGLGVSCFWEAGPAEAPEALPTTAVQTIMNVRQCWVITVLVTEQPQHSAVLQVSHK